MRNYNDDAIKTMVKTALIEMGTVGSTELYIKKRFPNLANESYQDDFRLVMDTIANTSIYSIDIDLPEVNVVKTRLGGNEPENLPIGAIIEITYEDKSVFSNVLVKEGTWAEIEGSVSQYTSGTEHIRGFISDADKVILYTPSGW